MEFLLLVIPCMFVFGECSPDRRPVVIQPRASASGLHIDSNPGSIVSGFHKELNVNCSFDLGQDFSTIISLILSKSDTPVDNEFRELGVITQLSRYAVDVKNSTIAQGAQVSGQLLPDGKAFISFKWPNPTTEQTGKYQCQAFGMDKTGHVKTSTANATVYEGEMDLHGLMDYVKNLDCSCDGKGDQGNVDQRLNETNHKLNAVISKQNELISQLTNLANNQNNMLQTQMDIINKLQNGTIVQQPSKPNNPSNPTVQTPVTGQNQTQNQTQVGPTCSVTYQDTMDGYHVSACTNGSFYLLPNDPSPRDENAEIADCEKHGGYLVEINNEAEYDFVANFASTNGETGWFMIGGTDAATDGTWVFQHSGEPVTFFKWGQNEPDSDPKFNCLNMKDGYGMSDVACAYATDVRYVCELCCK